MWNKIILFWDFSAMNVIYKATWNLLDESPEGQDRDQWCRAPFVYLRMQQDWTRAIWNSLVVIFLY